MTFFLSSLSLKKSLKYSGENGREREGERDRESAKSPLSRCSDSFIISIKSLSSFNAHIWSGINCRIYSVSSIKDSSSLQKKRYLVLQFSATPDSVFLFVLNVLGYEAQFCSEMYLLPRNFHQTLIFEPRYIDLQCGMLILFIK